MRILPYVIARSAAHEMDRNGPPSRAFIIATMLLPGLFVLGFAYLLLQVVVAVLSSI